ncbi:hypothetical protein H0H92_007736 [Tricholoma furcatifolium]|nr:hypothetical protein H0H92_007736 [Tricholoma furcatifolium]
MVLTCRSLRGIAQPLLFKTFSIRHDSSPSASLTLASRRDFRSGSSLVRLAVLQRSHLTNAITEIRLLPSAFLDVASQGPPSPEPTKSLLVDTLFAALPSLPNLRKFICHDVTFAKHHLLTLSRMASLKELDLQSCRTSCDPEEFPNYSATPWEALTFHYPFQFVNHFRNPRFLSHLLQSRNLRELSVGPANEVLSALMDTPPPSTLSILKIPVSCVASPLFVPVLALCTGVQELSLHMAMGDTYLPPLDSIPPEVLPNLRSYDGPRTYAPLFTRDRFITDLNLSLPAQSNDLCATLGSLARGIESLSCKVDDLDATLLQTIHSSFPSLKHLAISGTPVDIDNLSSVLSRAKGHSGLTSIQIAVQTGLPRLTDSWGATVAKMFLSRLIPAYPILERAQLVYQPQVSVVWNRSKERRQPMAVIDASELTIVK